MTKDLGKGVISMLKLMRIFYELVEEDLKKTI